MKILIAGSTGLIGTSLGENYRGDGHEVVALSRGEERTDVFHWDPVALVGPPADALEGVDVIINLAGANLNAHRWTERFKVELRESRIRSTVLLVDALLARADRARVLINASAVGFYGNRGDSDLAEDSGVGEGFLAALCRDWEAATGPASKAGIRVVLPRIGPVLSPVGGVLATMIPAFRLGTGGWLGRGNQWLPWISLPDTVKALRFLAEDVDTSGPINVVAPNPVTNKVFAKTLGKAMHRPALMSIPRVAAHLMFGDVIDEVGLASTRAVPGKLSELGFHFEHPKLDVALRAVMGK